ncbi:F0F1 ATP synthase subunit B family protein [Desulfonema magnum]|uniref:ATP synthase subunit b n=1 Tax=Desulfonema magnum TaxID=45655 RepID=A0A975BUH8_9BACT|nr:hypothetical protein [Desulfonema magnum]QTA91996.1 ATP synthase, subunit beta (ATP synthase F0 sector subunit b) [Desulfonema magnum]
MQIISNIALISINETLIIELISFLIFMFIMTRIMFRPLRNVMQERDGYISKIESEIDDAEKELDNVTDQLKKTEIAVRQEAFGLKEELEESGSRQAKEIFDAASKEIATLKEKTQKDVDTQISQARKHFKAESEALSVYIMEKILERRLVS